MPNNPGNEDGQDVQQTKKKKQAPKKKKSDKENINPFN